MKMKKMIIVLICFLMLPAFSLQAQRIEPGDLHYIGAFRLPDGSGGSDWNYSGMAMTWYPQGDADGPDDGFPGSLFAVGHDHQQFVSEISIPPPVISPSKNPADLPVARTLQPFAEITAGMFGYLEMPTPGLAWLPAKGDQSSGKLYWCRGQHIQYQEPTHGWCETDLSNPRSVGPWYFGDHNNYTTCDYLFDIPQRWADENVNGYSLASGRWREGIWSGMGPAFYASAPWLEEELSPADSTISATIPLLLYGIDDPALPEIVTHDSMKMNDYNPGDQWTGACWLTAGDRSALLFAGTRAVGNTWYGYSDGTVWPEEGPWPPVPEWPHDNRGFWSDSISARFLFYDTDDLAAVARGDLNSYQPQPYAVLDINHLLFDPGYGITRYKRFNLGAACFDRENGLLYVMERQADEEKSLVHVWRLRGESTRIGDHKEPDCHLLLQNYPNPFNPRTRIEYRLSVPGHVHLSILDVLGQQCAVLVDRVQTRGVYKMSWNARGLASGTYIIQLKTAGQLVLRRAVLIR
ncbi:T9SS type A sorting domain-containing protein [candidate division KSB1 bacterium]|nr:T9SS type A sorting domain-containing protein [candidate division KSB1 bacterium]